MIVHALHCKLTYGSNASILTDFSCNNAYMKPIGEILREVRELRDMSQEIVAAKVRKLTGENFSRAALSQIESGLTKNPKPHNLQAACDVLGIDFRGALNGKIVRLDFDIEGEVVVKALPLDNNISPAPDIKGQVPLISSVPAGDFREAIDNLHPGDYERMIDVSVPVMAHTFALRVDGDSMEPEFRHGDVIIVEPDMQAEHGDYVIAKNGGDATFKQLWKEGADWYLKPLNDRYPIKPLHDSLIIGVVREKSKRYK